MDDLVQRLRLFEEYMKHERQDYSAELLHRTIDRIEQLEANERAWLATNEDLRQAYQQAADRIEQLERESDEDIRNCEKQLAARDHRIERLEAALILEKRKDHAHNSYMRGFDDGWSCAINGEDKQ